MTLASLTREGLSARLEAEGYFADEGLLTAVFLAASLGRPLLLEGEPGVGKTEVAAVLSRAFALRPIRLQCYDGIDASQAIYEWNHARQLLHLRRAEGAPGGAGELPEADLYDPRFLIERPLLAAVRAGREAVLLLDEVDRADPAFEAYLLEFLSDFAVTIPELGTVAAAAPPFVVLTSNRTRELHDALRRRCLYHWIDFPDAARERRILRHRVPGLPEAVAERLVGALAGLRELPLAKKPGIAESLDWAEAACRLAETGEDWSQALRKSLGLVVKDRDDSLLVGERLDGVLGGVPGGVPGGRP